MSAVSALPPIAAAMPPESRPAWPGSVWIGMLDVAVLEGLPEDGMLALQRGDWYETARFLVRDGGAVLGFVDLPLDAGHAAAAALRTAIQQLPRRRPSRPSGVLPSVSVVICTRDRASSLRTALESVVVLDYPSVEIVVVDNASSTSETRDLVVERYADRVRLVIEPVPGLARARNAGLAAATGDLVAFTDDDVVVDAGWLRGLVQGFSVGDVGCVTGLVPSGELVTPLQAYFDDRVKWSRNTAGRTYRLADPPRDLPLFPFSVGEFGTGANFAVRRSVAQGLDGFDPVFGVGTRTAGGEDLDFFTRVLLAGHALVVEPDAVVWHRHRRELSGLRKQTRGYGVGLGAWLTKIALQPRTLSMALRRAPRAIALLLRKRRLPHVSVALPGMPKPFVFDVDDPSRIDVQRLARYELWSVFAGPVAYVRERLARSRNLRRG